MKPVRTILILHIDPDRVLEGEHSKPPNKMRRSGNGTCIYM